MIVTPHRSAHLPASSDERGVEIFLANLAAYAHGEPLLNER